MQHPGQAETGGVIDTVPNNRAEHTIVVRKVSRPCTNPVETVTTVRPTIPERKKPGRRDRPEGLSSGP